MDLALQEFEGSRFEIARGMLDAVLSLEQDRPEALLLLADVHRAVEQPYGEAACLTRLNHVCPGDSDLLCRLALLMSDAIEPEAALAAARQAVILSPDDPDVRTVEAKVLRQLGHWDSAVARLSEALEIDPEFATARLDRAMLLLARGDLAEAWPDFEYRHEFTAAPEIPSGLPRWQGEPFPDRRLLITTEGGHGDNIWAARFIRDVAELGGKITLQVRPAVRRLFESVEGVDDLLNLGQSPTDCDLYCPILSLAGCLKVTDPARHPPAQLKPVSDGDEQFESLLQRAGDQTRVGIIWSGSETYANNSHRAARIADFLPLLTVPGIQLISLQKEAPQLQLSEQELGSIVLEADDGDFAETAALIEMLDLIIMTDTAVAHIAGSMGKPVWVLLDSGPHWYFGMSEKCSWYPSMRLFRQSTPGDWSTVMKSVIATLNLQRTHASKIQ